MRVCNALRLACSAGRVGHKCQTVEVGLDEGSTGWVLPDDEKADPVEPWAALLPDDGPRGGFFRDGSPLPW